MHHRTGRRTPALGLTAAIVATLTIGLATPAHAAIAFEGAASAIVGSGSGHLTIAKPSGTDAGELMIAAVAVKNGTTDPRQSGTNPTNDWTLIGTALNHTAGDVGLALLWKVAGVLEQSSYGWNTVNKEGTGGIQTFSGVDITNPIDQHSTNEGTGTSTMTATGVTTSIANGHLLAFFATRSNQAVDHTAPTTPATMTRRFQTALGDGYNSSGHEDDLGAVGATGNRTSTARRSNGDTVNTNWVARLVALRPLVPADTTAPTVTVEQAAGQADPTATSPIDFTVTFSEAVTGFTDSDVSLGGSASPTTAVVTGTGPYSVAVSGMSGSGTVTASVPSGGATDGAGNGNAASTSTDNSVTYDVTAPTVTVEQAAGQSDPTATSPVNFTVMFSEAVTGFTDSDVSLGGSASPTTAVVTGTGPYNVAVSGMTSDGTVTASVSSGGAADAAGNANAASTSSDGSVTYDTTAPAVTVEQASGQTDPTATSPINFTVAFSETVTGFSNADVTLGGTASPTTAVVTGTGPYNVAVSGMSASGTVMASVPSGGATDGAGNANQASTSSDNTVTYVTTVPDLTPPLVTVEQAAGQDDPTSSSPIDFTVDFSETVTGFTDADVLLTGTADPATAVVSATGDPTVYDVAVSDMDSSGTVIVSVPAGGAADGAANPNLASVSLDNQVSYTLTRIGPSLPSPAPAPAPSPGPESPPDVFATGGDPHPFCVAPTIVATEPDAVVVGTPGPDVILALSGDVVVRGGDGSDVICTGGGDDLVRGGRGRDTVWTGEGDDVVRGGRGRDLVAAATGDNDVRGGGGGDRLFTGPGADHLDGGRGWDECGPGPGPNRAVRCETLL